MAEKELNKGKDNPAVKSVQKKDSPIKAVPDKAQPRHNSISHPSDNYQPREEPKQATKKEVKDSIDRVIGINEEKPPVAEPAKALDAILSGAPSPNIPQAEQHVDIASIYKNNQQRAENDNNFYARNNAGSQEDGPRRAYQNNSGNQDSPMKDYAMRPRNFNAQGQDTDLFGHQDLSILGRIQRLYSRL